MILNNRGGHLVRKNLLVLSIMSMVLVPLFGLAADTTSFGPQAFLPESVFEFQPLVEGNQVVHRFILHNRGEAPLEILKIESG